MTRDIHPKTNIFNTFIKDTTGVQRVQHTGGWALKSRKIDDRNSSNVR